MASPTRTPRTTSAPRSTACSPRAASVRAYFGPNAQGLFGLRTMPDAQIDFFVRMHMDDAALAAANAQASDDAKAAVRGYVAGFNRYLADIGVDHLPLPCRGTAWARPMTIADFHRLTELAMVTPSVALLADAVLAARPPVAAAAAGPIDAGDAAWAALVDADRVTIGSNGWAFGSDVTSAHTGLLLGNPHFPWVGAARFWQMHLTIPGKLDVMGASIGDNPVVHIGFNRDVAWTHTVSTGKRDTLYELQLVPGDPTSYMLDGAAAQDDARRDDDRRAQRRRQHGRAVGDDVAHGLGPGARVPRAGLGWTAAHAYAIRDANALNARSLDAWLAMNRATSVEALRDAMGRQGIPWVNTIAADRDGKVLYADLSNVPDVTAADLQRCAPTPRAASLFASAGLVVLDGSRAECGWRKNAAAAAPGLIPASRMPVAVRRDWVQNSNDSFWLTNPAIAWPDISPLVGLKGTPQGLRTRMGLTEITRELAGQNRCRPNGIGPTRRRAHPLQRRQPRGHARDGRHARTVRRGRQRQPARRVRGACALGPHQLARRARGAAVSRILAPCARREQPLARAVRSSRGRSTRLRASTSPTPSVKAALPAIARRRRQGICAAPASRSTSRLRTAQVKATPHGPVPVPGGEEIRGRAQQSGKPGTSRRRGYDIDFGSSYIQLVTFDADGPIAWGMLTYGQASDPMSPYAYDQLDTFSKGEWPRLPYTRRQIDAHRVGPPKTLLVH